MDSNTPPTDTSPANITDINTTNNLSTPNTTNVVSQSQRSDGIKALIEATVRTSNGVFSPLVEGEIGDMEAQLYDDNLHAQVPASELVIYDTGVMPETLSPVKRDLVLVNFDVARKKRKGDGVALRQTNYEARRLSLQRAFPFDTLCTFLRDSNIDDKLESLRSKPISMNNTMRSSLNCWKNIRIEKYPPSMVDLKYVLNSSPHPLGQFGRRMFIEDYMMLEPGDEVICYIHASHPDFKDSKANQKLFFNTCSSYPLRPMVLSGKIYFAMKITVKSNALYESFKSGIFTNEELKTRCTKVDGSGVTFEFRTETRITPKCFKFSPFQSV